MERKRRIRKATRALVLVIVLGAGSVMYRQVSSLTPPSLLAQAHCPIRDMRKVGYCEWISSREACLTYAYDPECIDIVTQRHTVRDPNSVIALSDASYGPQYGVCYIQSPNENHYAYLHSDVQKLAKPLQTAAKLPLRFRDYIVSPSGEYLLWNVDYPSEEGLAFWYR